MRRQAAVMSSKTTTRLPSLLLFVCITNLALLIEAQQCPELGISSHVVVKNGAYRLTTLQRGNFTIQSLITFNKRGENGQICDEVSKLGIISVYAMQYAVEKINSNKALMPWGTIGLQLDNVCANLTLTMARGIEAVSLHRPNSVCRADFLKCDKSQNLSSFDVKPVTAIVGTEMSATSIPLASLLSLYHIPQISFSASSRLLSKKELYKSFFRTIPSDTNQISVMLGIIEKFQWNYVFAIGSDDDYGKLGISELKQNAQGKNICVAHDEYIPRGNNEKKIDAKIDEIIEKMDEEYKAQVVILFCYSWMGEKIFKKAKQKGIKRVWLTSEAWNPRALKFPKDLKNQSVGVLTVSLKRYKMPHLLQYMKQEMTKNFRCSMWLQNFLKSQYKCVPKTLSGDDVLDGSGTGCPLKVTDIVKDLESSIQGTVYNLVDAVTALAYGIHNYLNGKCGNTTTCSVTKIPPKELTKKMYKVVFKNDRGNEVSFNRNGDPKYAYYTIENIQQHSDGELKYVYVGEWDEQKKDKLNMNASVIQWPLWFRATQGTSHPSSRCSDDCKPGEYQVGKQECCWACQPCDPKTFSNVTNALQCHRCEEGFHTIDNKKCEKTETIWLKVSDAPGMAIVIISCVGFLVIILASLILVHFRLLLDDTSTYLLGLCCTLVGLTFAYGVLHIIEPSQRLCQSVNALFYLFLMFYTAIVMIKTKFFTKYLNDHSKKWFKGSVLASQLASIFLFLLIEAASIIAWFHIDPEQVKRLEVSTKTVFEIRRQCQVDPTAARYVATFIPIIILIIATFCAFRERNMDNMEHAFYETKFLSFTCIALCIIIVAYMPTFHYVVGKYKSIVMAITMDLFGFTFMGCLIFPKVYVAIMKYKRGIGPMMKPSTASPKESSVSSQSHGNKNSVQSSVTGFNNSQNANNLQNGIDCSGGQTSEKDVNAMDIDEASPRVSTGVHGGEVNGHADGIQES